MQSHLVWLKRVRGKRVIIALCATVFIIGAGALAIWEATCGLHHPSVVTCLNNLASLHRENGDDAKAIAFSARARAISQ